MAVSFLLLARYVLNVAKWNRPVLYDISENMNIDNRPHILENFKYQARLL